MSILHVMIHRGAAARRRAAAALVCGVAMLLAGCGGGYTMSGRVIEGDYSHIVFVSKDDPRLTEGAGVDGAMILVFRDPGTLGRKMAGRGTSSGNGDFQFTLSEFGAGWLVEDWEINTMRPGFANASFTGQIPRGAKKQRMLVVLAEGSSTPVPPSELLNEEYDRFRTP